MTSDLYICLYQEYYRMKILLLFCIAQSAKKSLLAIYGIFSFICVLHLCNISITYILSAFFYILHPTPLFWFILLMLYYIFLVSWGIQFEILSINLFLNKIYYNLKKYTILLRGVMATLSANCSYQKFGKDYHNLYVQRRI